MKASTRMFMKTNSNKGISTAKHGFFENSFDKVPEQIG